MENYNSRLIIKILITALIFNIAALWFGIETFNKIKQLSLNTTYTGNCVVITNNDGLSLSIPENKYSFVKKGALASKQVSIHHDRKEITFIVTFDSRIEDPVTAVNRVDSDSGGKASVTADSKTICDNRLNER